MKVAIVGNSKAWDKARRVKGQIEWNVISQEERHSGMQNTTQG